MRKLNSDMFDHIIKENLVKYECHESCFDYVIKDIKSTYIFHHYYNKESWNSN